LNPCNQIKNVYRLLRSKDMENMADVQPMMYITIEL